MSYSSGPRQGHPVDEKIADVYRSAPPTPEAALHPLHMVNNMKENLKELAEIAERLQAIVLGDWPRESKTSDSPAPSGMLDAMSYHYRDHNVAYHRARNALQKLTEALDIDTRLR